MLLRALAVVSVHEILVFFRRVDSDDELILIFLLDCAIVLACFWLISLIVTIGGGVLMGEPPVRLAT